MFAVGVFGMIDVIIILIMYFYKDLMHMIDVRMQAYDNSNNKIIILLGVSNVVQIQFPGWMSPEWPGACAVL